MAYVVILKGGPADGLKTIAGNTTQVYFAGHRYVLNSAGEFEYAPLRNESP